MKTQTAKKNSSQLRAGFTLPEILIAVVVVGIGFAAVCESMVNASLTTSKSQDLTKAQAIANEMREYTMSLPFRDPQSASADYVGLETGDNINTHIDDLDDYADGAIYSPPVRASGDSAQPNKPEVMSEYGTAGECPRWKQVITLSWRDPANPDREIAQGSSDLVYVEVEIYKVTRSGSGGENDRHILTTGWLVRGD